MSLKINQYLLATPHPRPTCEFVVAISGGSLIDFPLIASKVTQHIIEPRNVYDVSIRGAHAYFPGHKTNAAPTVTITLDESALCAVQAQLKLESALAQDDGSRPLTRWNSSQLGEYLRTTYHTIVVTTPSIVGGSPMMGMNSVRMPVGSVTTYHKCWLHKVDPVELSWADPTGKVQYRCEFYFQYMS